jgi:hypothetical protein
LADDLLFGWNKIKPALSRREDAGFIGKHQTKKPADTRRLQALCRQDAYFFGVIAS